MMAGGGVFEDLSEVCFAPFGRSAPARVRPSRRTRRSAPSLEQIVETDIGPRLFQFHHESVAISPPDSTPTREDVERLAALVIGTDEAATAAHFEKVCAQNHSYSTLLAYFVAPAARRLGEFWKEDICDFFEVTIGVGRLQAFMDRLATPEPLSGADARRKVLADRPPRGNPSSRRAHPRQGPRSGRMGRHVGGATAGGAQREDGRVGMVRRRSALRSASSRGGDGGENGRDASATLPSIAQVGLHGRRERPGRAARACDAHRR